MVSKGVGAPEVDMMAVRWSRSIVGCLRPVGGVYIFVLDWGLAIGSAVSVYPLTKVSLILQT